VGSYRQKRASVLRTILKNPAKIRTQKGLERILQYEPELLSKILSDLEKEGFIEKIKNTYAIR
jgi:DNA-binding MarR family transcriptional regulator